MHNFISTYCQHYDITTPTDCIHTKPTKGKHSRLLRTQTEVNLHDVAASRSAPINRRGNRYMHKASGGRFGNKHKTRRLVKDTIRCSKAWLPAFGRSNSPMNVEKCFRHATKLPLTTGWWSSSGPDWWQSGPRTSLTNGPPMTSSCSVNRGTPFVKTSRIYDDPAG